MASTVGKAGAWVAYRSMRVYWWIHRLVLLGVRVLVANVDRMLLVTHSSKNSILLLSPRIRNSVHLVVGNVRNADFANQAAAGADVIVHLAAQAGISPTVKDPRHDFDANALGTFNLLEAVHPRRDGVQPPSLPGKVITPLTMAPGGNTVPLRFGNVYGPRSGQKAASSRIPFDAR